MGQLLTLTATPHLFCSLSKLFKLMSFSALTKIELSRISNNRPRGFNSWMLLSWAYLRVWLYYNVPSFYKISENRSASCPLLPQKIINFIISFFIFKIIWFYYKIIIKNSSKERLDVFFISFHFYLFIYFPPLWWLFHVSPTLKCWSVHINLSLYLLQNMTFLPTRQIRIEFLPDLWRSISSRATSKLFYKLSFLTWQTLIKVDTSLDVNKLLFMIFLFIILFFIFELFSNKTYPHWWPFTHLGLMTSIIIYLQVWQAHFHLIFVFAKVRGRICWISCWSI